MATTMKLSFAKDTSKWTKSLPQFSVETISDEDAAELAADYACIVDGTLTAAEIVKTTPVAVE